MSDAVVIFWAFTTAAMVLCSCCGRTPSITTRASAHGLTRVLVTTSAVLAPIAALAWLLMGLRWADTPIHVLATLPLAAALWWIMLTPDRIPTPKPPEQLGNTCPAASHHRR